MPAAGIYPPTSTILVSRSGALSESAARFLSGDIYAAWLLTTGVRGMPPAWKDLVPRPGLP
jgi:hypothetical protein